MSEPRRWKDAPDAPIGVRELLSSARSTRALDDMARRRGASRVATLGVAPAAAAAAVGIWTKLAAAGVVGLAAIGTVVTVQGKREPPAPLDVAASHGTPIAAPVRSAVAAPIPPPEEPEAEPQAEPEAEPVRAAVPPPSRALEPARAPVASPDPPEPAPAPTAEEATPAPAAEPTLAAELALLEEARALLSRDPARALAPLEAHRRRFPDGALADERDLMELDALRRAGRAEDAADRARAWLARDPGGLHSTRVRAILASLEGR